MLQAGSGCTHEITNSSTPLLLSDHPQFPHPITAISLPFFDAYADWLAVVPSPVAGEPTPFFTASKAALAARTVNLPLLVRLAALCKYPPLTQRSGRERPALLYRVESSWTCPTMSLVSSFSGANSSGHHTRKGHITWSSSSFLLVVSR